ncbi:hypothetical protein QR680_010313 [Steinernema hermaphroditum]|uniref:Innexin n=1 Tax=Steinernema hermaphroditum TaxID=289476 RepID=A0AA39MB06_9BILA|nr:hypothetical protein QR680_010313 [Steinernema hermaphroditum]
MLSQPFSDHLVPTVGRRNEMFFHATLARTFIQSLSLRGDDDFVDRLNYYYTPIMLAVACFIISAKQYGGTPIECWVNPHSRESMEEYIESYCWIQNTYWVPMYENIPDDYTTRETRQIGYYQWVPFILIAEALMFSMPCIMWRLLNWQTGLNIQNVVAAAVDSQTIIDGAERKKAIESITDSLIDILDLQSSTASSTLRLPNMGFSVWSKLSLSRFLRGHYVTTLYMTIKICYTANIVLQFVLLNASLKSKDFALFGFQVLNDLFHGKAWTESGHFPRVTLCDFEVRYLANLNRYTVQCALLINIINEKVFAFFWCWYLILMVITSLSTLFWLSKVMLNIEKMEYVVRFMQIADGSERQKRKQKPSADQSPLTIIRQNPHLLKRFVEDFLKSDGVFTLRLIGNHAGELVVIEIVKCLWREFCARNWGDIDVVLANNENNHKTVEVRLRPTKSSTNPETIVFSNNLAEQ